MASRREQVSFDVRLELTEGIVFLANLFYSIAAVTEKDLSPCGYRSLEIDELIDSNTVPDLTP